MAKFGSSRMASSSSGFAAAGRRLWAKSRASRNALRVTLAPIRRLAGNRIFGSVSEGSRMPVAKSLIDHDQHRMRVHVGGIESCPSHSEAWRKASELKVLKSLPGARHRGSEKMDGRQVLDEPCLV